MRNSLICLLLSISAFVYAQSVPVFKEIDSLYREDQFYISPTYNILLNRPKDVSQNSFSGGISFGFLRDFPVNKTRTFAFAPGLGFTFSNYKQNLIVFNSGNEINYGIITASQYKKNKFSNLTIDVPLEIRWRNSTFESHKFWRIYTGLKFSYSIYNVAKYIDDEVTHVIKNNPDMNKFQYGVYLTTGYNTFNIYTYYSLNPIFNNGKLIDQNIGMNSLNIGLMFYIL